MDKQYLTIGEAAELLQVPHCHIYNLCNSGLIGAFKTGKHWRVPKVGLDAYIEQQIKLYNLK